MTRAIRHHLLLLKQLGNGSYPAPAAGQIANEARP
jgi:hypothetical protein